MTDTTDTPRASEPRKAPPPVPGRPNAGPLELALRRVRLRQIEVFAYAHNATRQFHPEQKRVMIFGQGRSGSSLLEDLLCATGYFERNGEVLTTRLTEVRHPLAYLNGRAKASGANHFVCHVKINHLTSSRKRPVDPHAFLEACDNDGWQLVFLRRNNLVLQAFSNFVARQRGRFQKLNDSAEELKLTLDLDHFERSVNDRLRLRTWEDAALVGRSALQVEYERDLESAANHQRTVDTLMDGIGLPTLNVATNYRKVVARPLQDCITNYDEFTAMLARNGWDGYLP